MRRLGSVRRGLTAMLTAVSVAVLATAVAAKDVSRENTLIFENISERVTTPENYNPFLPSTLLHAGLQQVGFESLFYYNYETTKLEPWQAESYAFNDKFDEVTIKLRSGIAWSDGVPFTAKDVVYTMNMLKANAPALGNWSVNAKTWVKDIVAVDDRTVKITLTSANPRFILDTFGVRIYGVTFILPEHIWKDKDPMTFSNFDLSKGWPVSTSPYRLVASNSTEVTWDRRDDWWGAKTGFKRLPKPERVLFRTAGSEERRAAMAVNNELDTLWVMGRANFESVKAQNPDVAAWYKDPPYAYLDPCPRYLAFNTTLKPFDDPKLRWAMSYAMNRDAIVDIAWEGLTKPAKWMTADYPALTKFIDPNNDLFEKYPTLAFDTNKTTEIMESEGYAKDGDGLWAKDGKHVSLDIVIRQGEADQTKMAPVVTQLLRRGGFDANFQLADIAAYTDALNTGRANAWLDVSCGGVSDPYATFDLYHSRHAAPMGQVATGARTRWKNADFDKVVDEMAVTSSEDPKLQDLTRKGLELWLPELPAIPLVQAALLASVNNHYWKNWPDEKNNYYHPGWWWATALPLVVNVEPAK